MSGCSFFFRPRFQIIRTPEISVEERAGKLIMGIEHPARLFQWIRRKVISGCRSDSGEEHQADTEIPISLEEIWSECFVRVIGVHIMFH